MKSDARNRFYWPGMSADIDLFVARCDVCAALRPSPPRAPLAPWPFPPRAWHRVHLDFLGPINGKTYLIIVDAYSKWVELFDVSSGYSSRVVIDKLCEVMSRFGLFHTICSDNGSSFVSEMFKQFCSQNGILLVTSPPYNPSSNGQAESYVKIIKRAIKSIVLSGSNQRDLSSKLNEFLLQYCNSHHSTTDRSPAEVLFGHKLRCRLDLITPHQSISAPSDTTLDKVVRDNQSLQCKFYRGKRVVDFSINELVLIKSYLNQRTSWIKGRIVAKLGKLVYLVRSLDDNNVIKRHSNQLLKIRGEEYYGDVKCSNASENVSTSRHTDEQLMPQVLLPERTTQDVSQMMTSATGEQAEDEGAAHAGPSSDVAHTEHDPEPWADCEAATSPGGPAATRRTDDRPTTLLEGRSKRPRERVNYKKYF
ncbi:hypothetical protein JYU34_012942 [Plutella xylostella]|uniref:RNA-directed DNA polymerase n=1 Tax=Plutella xylostella TaxID=51655 RepID=A0ABQ7QCI9_PLUXY|nr:hypothetical protein JYU34_012942 [Plutella xylostella]